MIVLDSTVLLYAKGAEHPLREPCRRLVDLVTDGKLSATTTTEVLQEVAHVHSRRRPRAMGAALARDYATLLSPLLVTEETALRRGLDLLENHARLGCFDAVLAATTMESPAEAVVSADGDFAQVDGLVHLTPADALERFGG